MRQWYYRVMGEEIGPFSFDEVLAAIIDQKIDHDTEVRSDQDVIWVPAGLIPGLFESANRQSQSAEAELQNRKKYEAKQKLIDKNRFENMTVSTSAPSPEHCYTIIDTVFAFDSHGKAGIFLDTEADPHAAFAGVKKQLKNTAFALGADAVINCQFEYRVAVQTNEISEMIGATNHAKVIELFAYGTAIRWENTFDETVANDISSIDIM